MASGLALFVREANRLSQQFSAGADELGPATLDIVDAALDKGRSRMRQIIMAGGINKTKKGGPRVKSGKMLGSVEGEAHINGRARVQGKFGFSDDTPIWTKWQEKGTKNGPRIPAMLAYNTANKEMVEELLANFERGKWFNLNL